MIFNGPCGMRIVASFFVSGFIDPNVNAGYNIKPKLYKHWLDVYKTSRGNDFDSSKQRLFFTLCDIHGDRGIGSGRLFHSSSYGLHFVSHSQSRSRYIIEEHIKHDGQRCLCRVLSKVLLLACGEPQPL
ncbi:hypothetical protein PanWU01x14_286550 [Parasponia andersonii]|uniref:Uncharacterized protein n=1 Tax=Parasponia andersonii TaxID=3476 RepID=A0A2P5AZ56_PARAD|nr:hypothetical protein PanWU01x14_286550 [Parasponia andersonii]